MSSTYNGWKNRQTWNVMLWIENDYSLYQMACDFVKAAKAGQIRCKNLYRGFVKYADLEGECTPDRIKWDGTRLDYKALHEAMGELVD